MTEILPVAAPIIKFGSTKPPGIPKPIVRLVIISVKMIIATSTYIGKGT